MGMSENREIVCIKKFTSVGTFGESYIIKKSDGSVEPADFNYGPEYRFHMFMRYKQGDRVWFEDGVLSGDPIAEDGKE